MIKEQPYSQDSSPDQELSLLPSATYHADVKIPYDTQTPLASLQERKLDFCKNIARIRKILNKEELNCQIHKKLTKRGYTTKELETLKKTREHSFKIRQQDINKSFLAKGPWTEEEVEILKMRKDHKHPQIITYRLARNKALVKVKIKHLFEYFQECNKAPLYKGP